MTRRRRMRVHSDRAIAWLPVDSRILPPLFSFGHVRGLARVFLIIEMISAVFVVAGSLLLASIRFVY